MPTLDKKKQVLATSVYLSENLSGKEVRALGDKLAKLRGGSLKAGAQLTVNVVTEAKLESEKDDIPFPGHVNILGWPDSSSEQKRRALILASESNLLLF